MAKDNVKELTPAQSIAMVKGLIFHKSRPLKSSDFTPGSLLMYKYNAKDKEQTYDRTPFVFILKRSSTHTLAINFHWAPMPMRVALIKKILNAPGNKKRIREGKPLKYSYEDLKPFLKRFGYAPIIRKYINKRISRNGVIIPESELMNAARIKSETFTQGKVSAESLYKKAISKVKKYRKTRKRRE